MVLELLPLSLSNCSLSEKLEWQDSAELPQPSAAVQHPASLVSGDRRRGQRKDRDFALGFFSSLDSALEAFADAPQHSCEPAVVQGQPFLFASSRLAGDARVLKVLQCSMNAAVVQHLPHERP